MSLKQVTIDAHPHAGQSEVHDSEARFKTLAAGRRWGKTRLGVNECLDYAVHGKRAWWVSPSYKTSEVGWRPLRQISAQVPGAEVRLANRTITFPGGGLVSVRSADNTDSLRGEGLDFVVLDECAFMKREAWTEALRPALSDREGGALFISTPKGRNWFWENYQRGVRGEDNWHSFRFPTSSNPYIPAAEIEAARRDLPDRIFRQEYLAEFLEGEGSVFRNIYACMTAPPEPSIEDHIDHRIVAGVDWAKQADFTAVSIGCATCGQELALDRFNKIDYHFQRERLKVLFNRWNVTDALVELNSIGEINFEELQRDGIPVHGFTTDGKSKMPLIENLSLTFEKEEFRFINDPIWTAELEAYEMTVNPTTGRTTYSAPSGGHDDTVIARALMVRAVTTTPWFIS